MDGASVRRDSLGIRIAPLGLCNRLRLGHSRRHSEVDAVASRVAAVAGLREALLDEGVLVALSTEATCGSQPKPLEVFDRIKVTAESHPTQEASDLLTE